MARVLVPTVALALALVPTTAQAATSVFQQSFRGPGVSGYASTQEGCIRTSTTVDADATRVFYSFTVSDDCAGVATVVFGSAPPTTFSVRGNLATGHVVATIPLRGADGLPAGEVLVDDTWTATEPATKGTYVYTENLPGEYRYSSRASGSRAAATVVGTVPLDEGYVWKTNQREISVTHL